MGLWSLSEYAVKHIAIGISYRRVGIRVKDLSGICKIVKLQILCLRRFIPYVHSLLRCDS
jgi:hypothetical protein